MKKISILIFTITIMMLFVKVNAFADYYTDNTTLKYSMSGQSVRDLQKDLKSIGYINFTPTGYFGTTTRAAIINYQKDNFLFSDGIVGKKTSRQIKVATVLNTAKQFLGVPYVWGGVSTSGVDCSGFTHLVLLQNDIIIQRTAALQYKQGTWVSKSNLKLGDLVFFTTYKEGASHVGFYLGNDKFIHASSAAKKVTISDLNGSYYTQHYIGAKRMIN